MQFLLSLFRYEELILIPNSKKCRSKVSVAMEVSAAVVAVGFLFEPEAGIRCQVRCRFGRTVVILPK